MQPPALSLDQQKTVREKIENGEAVSAIARQFKTSRQTIMRARDHAGSCGTFGTFVQMDPH